MCIHGCLQCFSLHPPPIQLYFVFHFNFCSFFLISLHPSISSALPHSQPSSSSPSPAISIESLSSASDHSSSHPSYLGGGATGDQDNPFTKSVSEPSICGPCGGSTPSTSANRLSPSPSPPPQPANPSSAPATPQSNRSARPPRPPTTPSPLAASSAVPVPPPKVRDSGPHFLSPCKNT